MHNKIKFTVEIEHIIKPFISRFNVNQNYPILSADLLSENEWQIHLLYQILHILRLRTKFQSLDFFFIKQVFLVCIKSNLDSELYNIRRIAFNNSFKVQISMI